MFLFSSKQAFGSFNSTQTITQSNYLNLALNPPHFLHISLPLFHPLLPFPHSIYPLPPLQFFFTSSYFLSSFFSLFLSLFSFLSSLPPFLASLPPSLPPLAHSLSFLSLSPPSSLISLCTVQGELLFSRWGFFQQCSGSNLLLTTGLRAPQVQGKFPAINAPSSALSSCL